MSELTVNLMNTDPARMASASAQQRRTMLRKAVNEVVGTAFFGEMLKIARTSASEVKFGHGGRGEEIFRAQLDQELARCAGRGMKNSLSEMLFNRLSKKV